MVLVIHAFLLPRVQDQAGGRVSLTINRGEAPVKPGRARGGENRDAGGTHVSAGRSPSSDRPLGPTGNGGGEWVTV